MFCMRLMDGSATACIGASEYDLFSGVTHDRNGHLLTLISVSFIDILIASYRFLRSLYG